MMFQQMATICQCPVMSGPGWSSVLEDSPTYLASINYLLPQTVMIFIFTTITVESLSQENAMLIY